MTKQIRCDEAQGFVVQSWRSSEEGLILRVAREPEEVQLQCVCGRCHWIVREQIRPEGSRLVVTCHNCGRRAVFPLETADVPAR